MFAEKYEFYWNFLTRRRSAGSEKRVLIFPQQQQRRLSTKRKCWKMVATRSQKGHWHWLHTQRIFRGVVTNFSHIDFLLFSFLVSHSSHSSQHRQCLNREIIQRRTAPARIMQIRCQSQRKTISLNGIRMWRISTRAFRVCIRMINMPIACSLHVTWTKAASTLPLISWSWPHAHTILRRSSTAIQCQLMEWFSSCSRQSWVDDRWVFCWSTCMWVKRQSATISLTRCSRAAKCWRFEDSARCSQTHRHLLHPPAATPTVAISLIKRFTRQQHHQHVHHQCEATNQRRAILSTGNPR